MPPTKITAFNRAPNLFHSAVCCVSHNRAKINKVTPKQIKVNCNWKLQVQLDGLTQTEDHNQCLY